MIRRLLSLLLLIALGAVVVLAGCAKKKFLAVENLPPERRSREANSLLNGPVINAQGLTDVVTSQKQVDDLLESLGF